MHMILRFPPLVIPLLLAAGALCMALISQYGFGTHPCHLCLLQRYPYGLILLICAAGLVFRTRYPTLTRHMLLLCIAAFIATSGIGAYHFGVEQGWIDAPDSCAANVGGALTLEQLKAQILGAPLVSCADVGASFLGVSMAGWNVLYGIASAICSLYLWKRRT
jgi:disulfide bond formation protein DsbB